MNGFDISATGMSAQRLRLDVIASNLANINTTRKADGTVEAYRRRNVVFAPILDDQMDGGQKSGGGKAAMKTSANDISFENGMPTLKAGVSKTGGDPAGSGVRVVQISQDTDTPLKMIYDPSHPDADKNGYVNLPNINPVNEMVDMIAATRAYEANVSAMQASKTMAKAAMEI